MKILVFKTNVKFKKNILQVRQPLNELNDIIRWNFDLNDQDKILRIETNELKPRIVEQTLQQVGFYCRELSD